MRKSFIAIGLVGSLAAFGSASTLAQKTSDGGDYRPMQINSSEKPEVKQGALEAARSHGGAGSEGAGTSMAPKPPTGAVHLSDEAREGAMSAARSHGGAGSESTGSSTAPKPTRDGGG